MDAYVVLTDVRFTIDVQAPSDVSIEKKAFFSSEADGFELTERLNITIQSPVSKLYKESQEITARKVLQELGIEQCILTIEDNHAIDPVLRARIKAAAKRYRSAAGDTDKLLNGGAL